MGKRKRTWIILEDKMVYCPDNTGKGAKHSKKFIFVTNVEMFGKKRENL